MIDWDVFGIREMNIMAIKLDPKTHLFFLPIKNAENVVLSVRHLQFLSKSYQNSTKFPTIQPFYWPTSFLIGWRGQLFLLS